MTKKTAAPHVERTDLVDRVRLYEERAVIEKKPERVGQVQIRKVVVTEEQQITVPLNKEYLQITLVAGSEPALGRVLFGDEVLEVGKTYEILLSEERATVTKHIYPISDIDISKQTVVDHQQAQLTLSHEELEVTGATHLVTTK